MNSTEWQQAKLDDIPSQHGAEFWREWTDDPAFGSRWHSVRHHFGLTSIGINANGGDAGDQIVVEHDEQEDANQDEVYFVVRGRGLKPNLVERAIKLSHDKYCSATAMLGKTAELSIDWEIVED